jgi:hypothetical protein
MTMPDEPIQEKALAAMADALSNLTGWLYPRVPTVERVLPPPPETMPSEGLPRIYVVPATGSRMQDPSGTRDGRAYTHALYVNVHGVIEADAETKADTWRWRLRHDVVATLHLNLSLSGAAWGLSFDDRPEAVDSGEVAPKAWFLQPVTILLKEQYPTAA